MSAVSQPKIGWTPRGPEAVLLESAMAAGFPSFGRGVTIAVKEPKLDLGQPDLLLLQLRPSVASTGDGPELRRQHLKVLHQLHQSRWSTRAALGNMLRLRTGILDVLLEDLATHGLVHHTTRGVRPSSLRSTFHLQRIVAIEAKLSNWRGAVEQAQRNTWFASDSYVLFPPKRFVGAAAQMAEHYGIGVFVFESGRVRTILRPRRAALPVSYGSWVVNEWVRTGAVDDAD